MNTTICSSKIATIAMVVCFALLSFFALEAKAQCYTSCPLITIINCHNTPARVTAQICCDNASQPQYSETFTVPAGSCGNNGYVIGFLPCYVTGVFIISSPSSATYTWDPATCTLTIN